MTTNHEVLSRTARFLGITSAGQEPAGNDAADLMIELQDAIDSLPLLRGGEWTEVILSSAADYVASDGERITTAGYAATITMPTTQVDEAGDTVPLTDLSRIQIVGEDHAQAGLWVFSASLGEWRKADGLAQEDNFPFGPEDEAGMAAIVAVGSTSSFGTDELSPVVAARAARQIQSFRTRFYREVVVRCDDAFLIGSNMGFGTCSDPATGTPD